MKNPFKQQIAQSDNRIAAALEVLQSHNRGLNTLADFKRLATGPASGLDLQGMEALVLLTKEFAAGRRDFLQQISAVVLPPKPAHREELGCNVIVPMPKHS